MKLFKIFSIVGIVCFFFLNSFSQSTGREEWVNKDVTIFRNFFEVFPLNKTSTLENLNNKLKELNAAKKDSTFFGGILYHCILLGGYVTIHSEILSYKNQIVWVQSTIYKDNIKSLNTVFNKDKIIRENFNQLFKLKINPNSFNDTVYQYTYTNQSLSGENKSQITEFIGKQSDEYLNSCEAEFNLLNKKGGPYPLDNGFLDNGFHKKYPPNLAVTKLKYENRTDCLLRVISGEALYGRINAIRGLLELVKEGKYILTKEEKDLIKKVLSLDLTVYYITWDIVSEYKYSESIPKILMEVLDDNYRYKKDSIYDKNKHLFETAQIIDQNPEYKGGYDAMIQYLKKNINYPDSAIKKRIEGTVFVQFVVSKTGKISKVKILRSIGYGCDEEAVRVVSAMPDWIPARGEGEAITSMFQIPVKFDLKKGAY